MAEKWNDDAIRMVIDRAKADGVISATLTDEIDAPSRNFITVGLGDGGCNMASAIAKEIPSAFTILYNTSTRAMDRLTADARIFPDGKDGSGKLRSYSQNIFKQGAYKNLIGTIQSVADKIVNLEYILVTTTAAGGTGGGVSPIAAKFISDNIDIPVILIGVYPSITEDATAQFNAMTWQTEVTKTGLPYIILDNNGSSNNTLSIHEKINQQVVDIAKILSGQMFGETNISSIDNRDMYMLLHHIGGRIAVYGTNQKPGVGKTLDDTLLELINKWNEPAPAILRGVGLFLKGPEDMIRNADTSLAKLRSAFGDISVQYVHLEISDEVYIALVCSGCGEPGARLTMMRQKYDEITSNIKEQDHILSSIISGVENPLGVTDDDRPKRVRTEMDLSALDL